MKKYQMALVASACLMNIFAGRTCLSEQTERSLPKPYYFPEGLLQHVYTGSYLLSQIPAGLAATTLPPHRLFELGVALSSTINIMFPFSCQLEPTYGMATLLRAIQGVADGLLLPALHSLWQYHTNDRNRPIVVTLPLAGAYLGTCLGRIVQRKLGLYFDWTACFYVFGVSGAALGYIWHLIAAETPDSKRAKKKQRMCNFATTYYTIERPKLRTIPYCKIFTSLRVWAITIASFVRFWTISTVMVIFLDRIAEIFNSDEASAQAFELFRCPITSSSLIFGALFFTLFHFKFSTTTVRKLATVPPFLLFPVILYLSTLEDLDLRTLFGCVFASSFLGGLSESGFNVNQLDVAPRFAGLLMSVSLSAGLVADLGSQLTITHLTTNHTLFPWAPHHQPPANQTLPDNHINASEPQTFLNAPSSTEPNFTNSTLLEALNQLSENASASAPWSEAEGGGFEPSTQGWHLVAYIAMGLNVFAGLLFAVLGSGRQQAWAQRAEDADTEMLNIGSHAREEEV